MDFPVIVDEGPSGALTITEIAIGSSSEGLQMNESSGKILALTVNYSDHSLMKNYSKEKTLKVFHSTVPSNTIDNYIRPCIEGYHLWPHDRIQVTEKASQVIFTFEKDLTAAEIQALSRSHRIGQDKNVIVYRSISSKTIEEKIRLLQIAVMEQYI